MLALDDDWKSLSATQFMHYEKGECIEAIGNIAAGIYKIHSGTCKLTHGCPEKNLTIHLLGKNSNFGLECLIEKPNTLSIICVQPCQVAFIEKKIAQTLFTNPSKVVADHLLNSNTHLIEKMVSDTINQADKKIVMLLLFLTNQLTTEWVNVSRKEIAEFSNVTKEHVVRILSALKKQGLISVDGRHFYPNKKAILKKYPDLKLLIHS